MASNSVRPTTTTTTSSTTPQTRKNPPPVLSGPAKSLWMAYVASELLLSHRRAVSACGDLLLILRI